MNRAQQLDSLHLDNDLVSILTNQLTSILRSFSIYHMPFIRSQKDMSKYISCLVNIVLLLKNNATFGMKLYNLKLATSNHKLYNVIRILLLSLLTSFEEDISHVNPTIKKLFKSLKLLNFLLFIRSGKYPTHHFQAPGSSNAGRDPSDTPPSHFIDDNHTNRQIMWQSLTELLQLGIPLYYTHIRPVLAPRFSPPKHALVINLDGCGICGLKDGMKATLGCTHVYCWYCLQKESNGKCPQC